MPEERLGRRGFRPNKLLASGVGFQVPGKTESRRHANGNGAIFRMNIIRTNSYDPDFQGLGLQLDYELNRRYGMAQSKYDEHNVIEANQTVIVGYLDDIPAASGCFKVLDEDAIEIKRMFVREEFRRRGISTQILHSLEDGARELGFSSSRLETGQGQPEAIALYKKNGYEVTENYGPYVGVENSLCMQKSIKRD